LDFFMSQRFFVVEWGSHNEQNFMTGRVCLSARKRTNLVTATWAKNRR
jgi:hypothetical protein